MTALIFALLFIGGIVGCVWFYATQEMSATIAQDEPELPVAEIDADDVPKAPPSNAEILETVSELERIRYEQGVAHGRALEWQERYFADIAKDKARRKPDGTFKAKHG